MTAPADLTIPYGAGHEIHVSVYRDYDGDRGVRLTVNAAGMGVQAKLTPEQAGELVVALRESGACVPGTVVRSAAELPDGSIVAERCNCWIKDGVWWTPAASNLDTTFDRARSDADLDVELANGATVLRVGPGGAL